MKQYFLAFIILCTISSVYSQKKNSINDSLYSTALNEHRNIRIILPKGYNPDSKKKYDVIYIIDGERLAEILSAIHDKTSEWKIIPKCIIVGVNNKYISGVTQRNRDLLPTHIDRIPLSGEADNYIDFFKNDLIPYINNKYSTTNKRILFGHSHGGTFSMYTFIKSPRLFTSYILADPSLWWDDNYVVKFAEKKLSLIPHLETSLFISGREGDSYITMGISKMNKTLKNSTFKENNWKSSAYKNETHFSIVLKTAYDGLKFVYRNFNSNN